MRWIYMRISQNAPGPAPGQGPIRPIRGISTQLPCRLRKRKYQYVPQKTKANKRASSEPIPLNSPVHVC